jgi:hypothetical protein
MTTAGVTASENDFAAGSFIQPVDGSETIIGIQGIEDGIKVTNDAGSEIDVQDARLVIGAEVATAGIVLYPTDTSLIAWVKSALRATGIGYTFDDDF